MGRQGDPDRERDVQLLGARQGGCVNARQLCERGWTRSETDWRVRSGWWRSLLPGVYLVAGWAYGLEWDSLPFATRAWAARLMHGDESVFCLQTAAKLWGIEGYGVDDATIHLRLPPGRERHQVDGVKVHTWLVRHDEVTVREEHQLTGVGRTVTDLVLRLRREPAVSVLDSALHQGLLVPEDLEELQRRARGRRGVARSREWWCLGDGRAESPLETRARLIAIDAGHPPDELQLPIVDSHGVLLGFGDLAWKRQHLRRRTMVVEADGEDVHSRPEALFRDRYRGNDIAEAGDCDLYRITWRDVMRPAYFVSLLRRNLAA